MDQPQRAHYLDTVRVLLINCLLYFHNNRVYKKDPAWADHVDLYRFQLLILQVGLDMFFLIAGMSAFFSWRSKKSPFLVIRERIVKLILAFAVALTCASFPRKIFLNWLKEKPLLEIDFYDGSFYGPVLFLPYLFFVTLLLLPPIMFVGDVLKLRAPTTTATFSCLSSMARTFSDNSSFPLSTKHFVYAALYVTLQCTIVFPPFTSPVYDPAEQPYSLPVSLAIYALVALATFALCKCVLARSPWLLNTAFLAHVSPFLVYYTLALPLAASAVSSLVFHNSLYGLGLVLLCNGFLAVAVCPTSFQVPLPLPAALADAVTPSDSTPAPPAHARAPAVKWLALPANGPLCCAGVLALGQLLVICGPPTIPLPAAYTPLSLFVQPEAGPGDMAIPSHLVAKFFLSGICHAAFYLAGFVWAACEGAFPRPRPSNAQSILFTVGVIVAITWFPPHTTGTTWLSGGYFTYKTRWLRLLYNCGSWLMVWTCIFYFKYMGNVPFADCAPILRFMRDAALPLFMVHVLMQDVAKALLDALVQPDALTLPTRLFLIQALVFLFSYAFSWVALQVPLFRKVVGVR